MLTKLFLLIATLTSTIVVATRQLSDVDAMLTKVMHAIPAARRQRQLAGDHVVDVMISFYNDSSCEKPIAENGEPAVSHLEIDSSEKDAQCRELEGGGFGNHYEFWCHPNGNEISGKLLCNPTCKQCLVSTEDKKEDGTSDFPLGEMKLDECLTLPEMDGLYLKFIGECPDQGENAGEIIGIAIGCLLGIALLSLIGCFVMKRRAENNNSLFSSSSNAIPVATAVEDGYNAPEYDQM